MKMVVRIAIVFTLLLTFVGGVGFAFPSLATDMGLDFWNLSEYEREVNATQRNLQVLDREGHNILNRIQLKTALINDLVNDRETFREVVIQFWTLNQQHPNIQQMIRQSYHGATDLERQCKNVIEYVRMHFEGQPSKRAEWERRLQLETQFLLADPEMMHLSLGA